MKTKLTTLLLALTATFAFGHGGVPLGPNKGRLLELSKNHTTHGEVTVKDGKFHIAVLDKDLKPVKVEAQSLTATAAGSDRGKAVKLEVTKAESGFSLPAVKKGQWLIVQFKENAKAKAVTARMEYNTANCEHCNKAEWLCECKHDHDHDHEHEHEKGAKKKTK